MTQKNIVFIGFMGSGKSIISSKLGEIIGREVISTDKLIERIQGQTIEQIFKDSGEAFFREVEKGAVRHVSKKENVIIDCGGGVVLDEENIKNLRQNGVIVYLKVSADFAYKQILKTPKRPLLDVDDPKAKIEELLAARTPLYEKADVTVNSEKESVEEICQDIIKVIENE